MFHLLLRGCLYSLHRHVFNDGVIVLNTATNATDQTPAVSETSYIMYMRIPQIACVRQHVSNVVSSRAALHGRVIALFLTVTRLK